MEDKQFDLETQSWIEGKAVPEVTSLTLLQAVYRDPALPLSTRLRAASIAISFELPKLAVTAVLSDQGDFAARLDRAIDRAGGVRMLPQPGPTIEHSASELRPANGQLKRRY
jgi:hypothetical protein